MALDSLGTNVPPGTDNIAGKNLAEGFAEAVVVVDASGDQINPATKENQAAEIALLQSLDGNAEALPQILRALRMLATALNAVGELKVAQSGGTISAVTTVGTVNLVTAITALNNLVAVGGISPSMDQYYASRAACAAINSRVL
jgi:hypothetical protein